MAVPDRFAYIHQVYLLHAQDEIDAKDSGIVYVDQRPCERARASQTATTASLEDCTVHLYYKYKMNVQSTLAKHLFITIFTIKLLNHEIYICCCFLLI